MGQRNGRVSRQVGSHRFFDTSFPYTRSIFDLAVFRLRQTLGDRHEREEVSQRDQVRTVCVQMGRSGQTTFR